MNFLIEKKIPRLVFISSIGVYGKVDTKLLNENYKSKKIDWYGLSNKKK